MNKLETEAIAEDTDRSRLKQLATQNLALRRIVAQNPAADEELLTSLASCRDKLTLKAVTANPNTPVSVLMKLGCKFPEALLVNPVFELLLLENPNFIGQMPSKTLIALLSVLNVPDYIIKLAAQRTEVEVLLAVVNNPKTSREILKQLSQSEHPGIALSALLHVNNNYEIAPQLTSKQEQILKSFLPKVTLTHNLEEELILGHLEAIPPSLLPYASKNYQKWLLNNPTNQETIKQISSKGNHNAETARKKALYSDTPEVLQALATHDNYWVRRDVASNPHTPSTLLTFLTSDRDGRVREKVATNPNTPPSVLLLLTQEDKPWIRAAVAKNPCICPKILSKLVGDPSSKVRAAVAINQKTPVEMLLLLAGDRSRRVRVGVAKNPNAPSHVLESIYLKDANNELLTAIAQNYNTSPEMAVLALLQLPLRQKTLMQNKVKKNPNFLNTDILPIALKQCVRASFSRLIVLLNPVTPREVVDNYANSVAWMERYLVATHPNTSIYYLKRLAEDSNRFVRAAARVNLSRLSQK